MAYFTPADLQLHKHDEKAHKFLQVAPQDGPASPYLRPGASNVLSRSPILVLSTLDSAQNPCITVWEGRAGFIKGIGQSNVVIRAIVNREHDLVAKELLGSRAIGEVMLDGRPTKMVSMLGIDLEAHIRVKLYGRLVSGALAEVGNGTNEVLLVITVERSFITRPGSFSPKHVLPNFFLPRLISQSLPLIPEIVNVLAKAEVLFISSSNHNLYLDIDQRSGPPGFVHLSANDENGCTLAYPEYSGIRLYQTLDNRGKIPTAALLFPDFSTGNAVFITGRKEVLAREDAIRVLPRSNIAVRITVQSVRYIEHGLTIYAMRSPRASNAYGTSSVEQVLYDKSQKKQIFARLVDKQLLTPTVARFGFHIVDAKETSQWEPGQYVTLGFERLLGPQLRSDARVSENTYARKFTISSGAGEFLGYCRFEITIRKVGIATEYLFSQDGETGVEIPIRGFGGEFIFQQKALETIGFVAGGVGITPLLAQTGRLHLPRTRVYWTVRAEDLGLVVDSFEKAPELCGCTRLFVTGEIGDEGAQYLTKLGAMEASVEMRRMACDDLQLNFDSPNAAIKMWYVCTGAALRKTLLEWLNDRNVIFETFNF
ncbi:oxidoreductase-like protein [Mollisia scopiformis]|uniref:Oxidoreductase-like protein n=1 Tax=Mollisia scopiformis TaxID=149040 RepID=A0A194WS89_MOLSC|nr:oxidoreductase-like protein [Mollisia scopiformis]KUJ10833.1 oxidoreductase-like protein [Mollisia scopiformis]